jgi:Xaa-Pro aminopeptidase
MVKSLNRVDALKEEAFEKKGFDGFLVTNEKSLLYFTSCPGLAGLLIPKVGENTVYVYSTNYEQAKAEAHGFNVEMLKRGEDLMAKIGAEVKTAKIKKLAVDALSYDSYHSLAKCLKGKTKLKARGELVWELRRVKDENEIMFMKKAGELADVGIKVAYEVIRPGIKEIEAAAEIEYAMRREGSWGTAFESIVASGARSAFPHGGCSEREIENGDLVVVDIGAAYQHYCSDITRTLVAGRASEKQKKLYEIVKEAQERAFQAIKPKAKAKDVDAIARKVIADAGYGGYFVHGLGHGIGLDVHEQPTINSQSKDKLMIGNVVTDEPGIYLVGFGGVRIEDTVLVQKRHGDRLTKSPYSLETRQ